LAQAPEALAVVLDPPSHAALPLTTLSGMLASICCAASTAATKAGEVVTDVTDKASAAVKAKANEFTLWKLKQALEGKTRQLWEAPDVYVTFLKVELQEGVGAQDLLNFHLKGVAVSTKVEIVGTAAQLAGMTAAIGTSKVAEKVSAGESAVADKLGIPNLGIGAFVAASADAAREGLKGKASGAVETKSSDFNVLVDLDKTLGVQDVKATVRFVDTTNNIAQYMANGTIQEYIEAAISREVTKQCTAWQDENITLEKAKAAVTTKATEVAEMAKEKVGAK